MIAGPLIQLDFARQEVVLAWKRWGIIHANEGEFILPDSFGVFLIMPLSPTSCLVADEDVGAVSLEVVTQIYGLAMTKATIFLAARDLANCSGLEDFATTDHSVLARSAP